MVYLIEFWKKVFKEKILLFKDVRKPSSNTDATEIFMDELLGELVN